MDLSTEAVFICPHCKEHTQARIAGEGWFELTCQQCKRGFNTLLATVRAKRSRGDRRGDGRGYSVRVKHNGQEELIEFDQSGYEDFELRAGDVAAFSYVGGSVIVIENKTIGQARITKSTWREIVYGLVGVSIVAGLIYWFLR